MCNNNESNIIIIIIIINNDHEAMANVWNEILILMKSNININNNTM